MIRNVNIVYKDLELTVNGYHSPYVKGTYDTPHDNECFEIDRIYWGNINVTPIFESLMTDWCEIEEKCLERLKDYYE